MRGRAGVPRRASSGRRARSGQPGARHASVRSGSERLHHHHHDHPGGLAGVPAGGKDPLPASHPPPCRLSPVVVHVCCCSHLVTPPPPIRCFLFVICWTCDCFSVDVFSYREVMGAASGRAAFPCHVYLSSLVIKLAFVPCCLLK